MQLPEFLTRSPPPGYIAGIGRGAVGFSIRGTKGPNRVPARLSDREKPVEGFSNEEEEDIRFKDSKEEESHLISTDGKHDNEEDEAEDIFAEIDQRLATRRKKKAGLETDSQVTSTIANHFSGLKRNLAELSEQDWLRIPEAGDITKANKRSRLKEQLERKTYSAPDTLFKSNVNLTRLTEEREKLLALQLDSSFKTKSPDNSTRKYLQDLESSNIHDTPVRFDDVKKSRHILEAYRKANPRDPQVWIDSARLEEGVNKFTRSKNLIEEGCKLCPRDENIWLENVRLNSSDRSYCRVLISEAIRFNERSERIWLKAIDLEQGDTNKKRVIRKGLQRLPKSEKLWKLAIKHENERNEVIKILKKCLELLPDTVEFWTLLISLQEPTEARVTLESAKKIYSGEQFIWILSCQLEEASGRAEYKSLCDTISTGISEMQKKGTEFAFADWIREAIQVEKLGKYMETVKAIVFTTMHFFFDENSMDYEELLSLTSNSPLTRRCVYSSILSKFPGRYSIWKSFIKNSQESNDLAAVKNTWEMCLFKNEAVREYPLLVLMYTKFVWAWGKNCKEAIDILDRALSMYPEYTGFRLAKLKILIHEGAEKGKIKSCFEEAFSYCGKFSNEVSEYYTKYLLSQKEYQEAELYLDQALEKCPDESLNYLLRSEVSLMQNDLRSCQLILSKGMRQCPNYINLYIEAAKVESRLNDHEGARSILNIGLVNNQESDQLYQAKAILETKSNNNTQARHFVAQGLKMCPESWRLWSENIKLLPKKSMRKTMFQDALNKTNEHPMIMVEIGKVFAYEFQFERAKTWFQRAIKENGSFGDSWAWLYYTETQLDSESRSLENIIQRITEEEPRFGPLWENFTNSHTHFTDSPDIILKLVVSHIENSIKDGRRS